MASALLVIDVQAALCAGPHAVFDADAVIDRINAVSERVRRAGGTVVLVQHESASGPLAHGSPGWQLSERLATAPSDVRLRKRATDSFHQSDLQSTLEARAITHLVVCGFQSDFCVDTTTRRALALGYPVTLVADGHSTSDNSVLRAAEISAHHNATLSNIRSFGPRATLVAARDVRCEP